VAVRAEIFARSGEIARAERDQREALRLRAGKSSRRDHPLVIASTEAVGDVLALAGRREEALRLHNQVRAARIEAVGTWSSGYWVAQSDARIGALCTDREEAEQHLRAAEKAWDGVVRPTHPRFVALQTALST
jgi:hypothetical protein